MKMKRTAIAIIVLALCVFLTSCMDIGNVEEIEKLSDYISEVELLSPSGDSKYSISKLVDTEAENLENEIPTVIDAEEFCYIGFKAKCDFTVSEFGFFARSSEGSYTLKLQYYVIDEMPDKIQSSAGELSFPDKNGNMPDVDPSVGTYEGKSEEEVFADKESFLTSDFKIDTEWDSIHLEFDSPVSVKEGQYIVVRVLNNCAEDEEGVSKHVKFTFNYPLFYFEEPEAEGQ